MKCWPETGCSQDGVDQVLINVSLVVAGVGILCTLDLELVLGLPISQMGSLQERESALAVETRLVVAFGVCAFIVFFVFALCGRGPQEALGQTATICDHCESQKLPTLL